MLRPASLCHANGLQRQSEYVLRQAKLQMANVYNLGLTGSSSTTTVCRIIRGILIPEAITRRSYKTEDQSKVEFQPHNACEALCA